MGDNDPSSAYRVLVILECRLDHVSEVNVKQRKKKRKKEERERSYFNNLKTPLPVQRTDKIAKG